MNNSKTTFWLKFDQYEGVIKLLIFFTIISLLVIAWLSNLSIQRPRNSIEIDLFFISLPLTLYSVLIFIYFPYRALLFFLYRPYTENGYRPKLTIVIPAYNESENVKNSLISAIKAYYPKDKKQIIVINDGSVDDTLQYILEVKEKYPEHFELISFEQNKGKREAMAAGFRKATGDIFVVLDSDSVMHPPALYNLVSPFEDSKIGAATGKVRVLNKKDNLLTRMVGVRYIMAFDFYRSTRSTIKTVFCCTGVLSAYRREIILKNLDVWLNQTFLGEKCTYGDDRALTNITLREGYDTVYSRNAIAETTVPRTLAGFCKMVVRWNKSFTRESIVFAKFMFTKYREKNRVLPIFDFTLGIIMTSSLMVMVIFFIFYMLTAPLFFFHFLAVIAVMGFVYMLFYIKVEKNSDFIYGVLYSFLHIFVMVWTIPYAILTLKNNSWLTK